MPTQGRTLKVQRARASITATALAAQMGISRATLWVIERSAIVPPVRVTQYLQALETLRSVKEGDAA